MRFDVLETVKRHRAYHEKPQDEGHHEQDRPYERTVDSNIPMAHKKHCCCYHARSARNRQAHEIFLTGRFDLYIDT